MSDLRKKRPSRRRFPTLLIVFVFVLGPLTIAAYACENAGVGGDPSAESTTPPAAETPPAEPIEPAPEPPVADTGTPDPSAGESTPPPAPAETETSTGSGDTPSEPAEEDPGDADPKPTEPGNGSGGSGSTGGTGGSTSGTGATGGTSNPSAGGGTGSPVGGSTTATGATGGTSAPSPAAPVQSQAATPIPSGIVEPDDPEGSSSDGTLKSNRTSVKASSASGDTSGVANVAPAQPSSGGSSSSESGSRKSAKSPAKKKAETEAPAEQRRNTIARAVDGIPLSFRIALLALIFSTSVLAVVSWRERRRATSVAKVAQLDHLTGLANREGFDRQMALEWSRAIRYGTPLGLVFVDLDHFKHFNDTNGHVAGDRLLREVAAAITATARGSDFTARLGGDEFVVLCPETDEDGLDSLVQRLRVEAAGMAVSLSIGSAAKLDGDEAPDDLVHRADAAMYAAKGGRRRGIRAAANPMLGSMRRG